LSTAVNLWINIQDNDPADNGGMMVVNAFWLPINCPFINAALQGCF
jgi:hypothetical protein